MTSCPASVEHCLHHSMHQLAHSILVIWSVTLGHTHICYIKGHTPVPNCGVYWGDHCAVWKGKVWSFCLTNEFGTVPRHNIAISAVAIVQVHQMPARSFGGTVTFCGDSLFCNMTTPFLSALRGVACGMRRRVCKGTTLSWQLVNSVCGDTSSTQNRP